MNVITLSQALEGYELAAGARRLSPNTIAKYRNAFKIFTAHIDSDPPFASITKDQLRQFFSAQTQVKKITVLQYYIALGALWRWAVSEGLVAANLVRQIDPPRAEKHEILPFTRADLVALLSALTYSNPYVRPGKRECRNKLPFAERNRAIILLLVDTGIRATELCNLRIHNVDVRNRQVSVFGKGDKERTIPYSVTTGSAIWRYLTTRKEDSTNDFLFITSQKKKPIDRLQLLKLLKRAGMRAGVESVHPHRFRHTFAITFLRNGGDVFSLQRMLGHSSMVMVRAYLAIAQTDIERAHKAASPVENWRL